MTVNVRWLLSSRPKSSKSSGDGVHDDVSLTGKLVDGAYVLL